MCCVCSGPGFEESNFIHQELTFRDRLDLFKNQCDYISMFLACCSFPTSLVFFFVFGSTFTVSSVWEN